MIEYVSLILAFFAWMAASLWIAAYFRMPIQVDQDKIYRSWNRIFEFERADKSAAIEWKLDCSEEDLLGATVVFNMNSAGGARIIERAKADIVSDVSTTMLRYEFSSGEINTAGIFDGNFQITFSDQSIETHPMSGKLVVKVLSNPAPSAAFNLPYAAGKSF